jgi:putative membrane protein
MAGRAEGLSPLSYRQRIIAITLLWMGGLVASGIAPNDRATWLMEVAPVLIALPLLWRSIGRFELTGLCLALICLHGFVLMLGGAYSYAQVPLGDWLRDALDLARNPYDRIGHFMQGFVPAIVIREILIRVGALRRSMLIPAVLLISLGISAGYELIEFAAAMALGQGADAFLGTQGDPWDTQWDMLTCLLGAAASLILLSAPHDRQIEPLTRA